jgi:hypothetical protein
MDLTLFSRMSIYFYWTQINADFQDSKSLSWVFSVMTSTRGGGMKTVNRSKRIEMGTT